LNSVGPSGTRYTNIPSKSAPKHSEIATRSFSELSRLSFFNASILKRFIEIVNAHSF
jgi:hypothetical protein